MESRLGYFAMNQNVGGRRSSTGVNGKAEADEMNSNESKATARREDDWEALIERRLSADLDAFLADADDATFVFPTSDCSVVSLRERVADGAARRLPSRFVAAATWLALTSAVVWCAIYLGAFDKIWTPQPSPDAAFHEFFAVSGVESFRVADSAFDRSSAIAADSLRRVGDWRDEVGVSRRVENFGSTVDSRLDAPETGVGVVLKNDPLVRFLDEYYLNDLVAAKPIEQRF